MIQFAVAYVFRITCHIFLIYTLWTIPYIYSIFWYMKELIRLRHESDVAVYGDFTEYEKENEALYIYNRNLGDENLLVVLNFTGEDQEFRLPEPMQGKSSALYISNYENDGQMKDRTLRPYEAVVYRWSC